jgi:arylsulfatase A-like enzyme
MPHYGFFSPWAIPGFEDGPEGEYLTDRLTNEAIDLIRHRDDRPFYLNLWYYSVHVPIQARAEAVAYFRQKAIEMGLDKLPALEVGEAFPVEHKRHLRIIRRRIQSDPVYAAMIAALDWNIGRLMAVLKEEKINENTVVIFTSDNGGLATAESSPTCNAPLAEGKGWMYEGGNRVPLILRHPAESPVATSAEPATSPDIYPTVLDMCGLRERPDQHVDGVSLLPCLRGEALDRQAIYWHYPHYGNQGGSPAGAVRAGRFKLVELYDEGRRLLFDLDADPSESQDLSTEQPERVAELSRMLETWRGEVGARMPEENPDYIPWA